MNPRPIIWPGIFIDCCCRRGQSDMWWPAQVGLLHINKKLKKCSKAFATQNIEGKKNVAILLLHKLRKAKNVAKHALELRVDNPRFIDPKLQKAEYRYQANES